MVSVVNIGARRKVAVIGAAGQLGSAIATHQRAQQFELFPLSRNALDITNEVELSSVLGAISPDVVINAAAYTAVDKAESEPEAAFLINAHGPELLAALAKQLKFKIIHISTDFVFDGNKSTPYLPTDVTAPLSIYGKSKLAGEQALLADSAVGAAIVRTSWLYSAAHPSFLTTMLRLMSSKPALSVVADQVGTPTAATSLANVICRMIECDITSGVYHWSDAGVASWYDFACEIHRTARSLGLLQNNTELKPISTAEYPTPARRPAYSVMDKGALYELLDIQVPQHWQTELALELQNFKATQN